MNCNQQRTTLHEWCIENIIITYIISNMYIIFTSSTFNQSRKKEGGPLTLSPTQEPLLVHHKTVADQQTAIDMCV